MPTFRNPFRHSDESTEARFSAWTDRLVASGRDATPDPDPDFADVAETATTVHRTVGLGAAAPLSTNRADAIWEQLMTTSTVSPATLSGAAIDTSQPHYHVYRPPFAPCPVWSSYLLTAALIAVIVVASAATIWRITDP